MLLSPDLGGGVSPITDLVSDLDGGTKVPPDQTWDGVPPSGPPKGVSPIQTWDGLPPPPHPDLGMGYSPHHRKCGQTKNITFPHPSGAGGNNQARLYMVIKGGKWNLFERSIQWYGSS